jgi:hypothetical protein
MSYDIRLVDPVTKELLLLEQPHFINGGTYAVGGTTELWLNITYNYSRYYYEATEGDPDFAHDESSANKAREIVTEYGIRGIYGKSGAQSIPLLKRMIEKIKAKYQDANGEWITAKHDEGPNQDYWATTAANALKPLYQLIAFAQMRPDGIWEGD